MCNYNFNDLKFEIILLFNEIENYSPKYEFLHRLLCKYFFS